MMMMMMMMMITIIITLFKSQIYYLGKDTLLIRDTKSNQPQSNEVNSNQMLVFGKRGKLEYPEKNLSAANTFANCWRQIETCLPTVFMPFTHTNLSLPTRVCQLKFAV